MGHLPSRLTSGREIAYDPCMVVLAYVPTTMSLATDEEATYMISLDRRTLRQSLFPLDHSPPPVELAAQPYYGHWRR